MKNPCFFILSSVFGLFVLIAVGSPKAASAAVKTWSDAALDQSAANVQNWQGGAAPVSGEDVVIPSGSTVNWDLAGVVPASIVSYGNLTLKSPLIVSGAVTFLGGTVDLNSQPLNVGSNLKVNGATLNATGSAINISGDFSFLSGNISLTASTVTLNGAGMKQIQSNGQHFDTLKIAANGGTIKLSDDLNVDGALSVADGELVLNDKSVTVMGGLRITGGTVTSGTGKIILAGSVGRPFVVSGGSYTADRLGTVEYRPVSGSITIEPVVYGNLILTGKNVFSLAENTTVNSTLSIGVGATLVLNGHALNLPEGFLANSGTITEGAIHSTGVSLVAQDGSGRALSGELSGSSGTLRLKVVDQALNRHGDAADIVSGAVTVTTLNGDRETVALEEQGAGSGVFLTPALVIHQAAPTVNNNQIELGQNDIVFVDFSDPQDAAGKQTLKLTVRAAATAAAGQPQIVDGPRLANWKSINTGSTVSYSVDVLWKTDLYTSSSLIVTSLQMTQPITAGSLDAATDHLVTVPGLVRGREYSYTVSSMTADGKTVVSPPRQFTVIAPGDRIKAAKTSAVYWYLNGKRNVFPDFTAYDSWFPDFKGVITVPADQLADIQLGKLVPVRGGTYLVKIQSDSKTYAVEPGGILRWIPTEAQAIALYGADWSKRVRDVDVSQFVSYAVGQTLPSGVAPNGYVYRTGSGEMGAVFNNGSHGMDETVRMANGIASRFIATIAPSAIGQLGSSSSLGGYEAELNTVFTDGLVNVIAPAPGL